MIENEEILLVKIIKYLPEYFSIFKKKIGIFFLVGLLGAICGAFYSMLQPNKYVATTTFFCDSEGSNSLGGYAGIASQFGFNIGSGGSGIFNADNIIELLKSKTQVKAALLSKYNDKKLLIDEYFFTIKVDKIIDENKNTIFLNKLSISEIKNQILKDSLLEIATVKLLKENIFVDKKSKNTALIEFKCIFPNQFFAKKIAEEIIVNTISYYTKYKTQKGQKNIDIIQHQVDSVRQMLFGGINEVANLNDLNVNPLRQVMKTNAQKSQSQLQVNSVLYTELLKNLELAKLSLRKDTPLIQIVDTPIIPMKNEKKGRLVYAIIFSFSLLFLFFLITYIRFVKSKLFV